MGTMFSVAKHINDSKAKNWQKYGFLLAKCIPTPKFVSFNVCLHAMMNSRRLVSIYSCSGIVHATVTQWYIGK